MPGLTLTTQQIRNTVMMALCNCTVDASGGVSRGRNTTQWATAKDHIDWLTGVGFTTDPAQAIVNQFWPTGQQPDKSYFAAVADLYTAVNNLGLWNEPTNATNGTNNSIFQAMSDIDVTTSTATTESQNGDDDDPGEDDAADGTAQYY